MTGRTRAKLAILALVAVVVGLGVPLATSTSAHVRYWAWRMRSTDSETRRTARLNLLAMGRPAIDSVLPQLVSGVADELIDAAAGTDPLAPVVFVGRWRGVESSLNTFGYEVDPASSDPGLDGRVWVYEGSLKGDPSKGLDGVFSATTSRVMIVATKNIFSNSPPGPEALDACLIVRLPEDDPLCPAILEATRARLNLRRNRS